MCLYNFSFNKIRIIFIVSYAAIHPTAKAVGFLAEDLVSGRPVLRVFWEQW